MSSPTRFATHGGSSGIDPAPEARPSGSWPDLAGPGGVPTDPSREGVQFRAFARQNFFTLEKVCRLCRKRRRAAAAVEFAVVAPLFFLLLFGMVEFGRMVMVQQVITNASREGARIGVLDGSTTAEVEGAVNTYLANAAVVGASVAVVPDPPSSAGYGEPVTVAVSVPFGQVSWLPSPIFLGGRTMTAATVMRRETVQ